MVGKGAVHFDEHGNALIEYDKKAEARLRLKFDLYIIPVATIMYCFCFLDRTNIGNARLAGLERDLGLKGYDYNTAISIFFVAYIVFELPSNAVCKIIRPGRYIPLLTVSFGLISLCTAFVESYAGLLVVRFFLGVTEAGMLPGIAFWMTRWYRKDELSFRLGLYIVASPLAGAFGGLLASGLLSLNGIGTIHTWKQIFLVEGIITVGLGIIGFFLMTDRPDSAPWLTKEEKALAALRIKSENVGTTVVVDTLRRKVYWGGVLNFNVAIIALIFLLNNMMVQGIAVFLPTLINALYPDKTTVHKQLLTVPPYIVGAFFVVFGNFLIWMLRRRAIIMSSTACFSIVGCSLYLGSNSVNVRYAGTFLMMAGAFPFGGYVNAWASNNLSPDSARAGGIAGVVMAGNIGGLISVWLFLPKYAPDFDPGLGTLLGGAILQATLPLLLWWYQQRENRLRASGARDHRLEGLTEEEKSVLGHKHPVRIHQLIIYV
ncbi:MFS general substrate transporter [Atractiella rhizophila]|nr:MFS general substrate transporter [Atractiella rhizophila]